MGISTGLGTASALSGLGVASATGIGIAVGIGTGLIGMFSSSNAYDESITNINEWETTSLENAEYNYETNLSYMRETVMLGYNDMMSSFATSNISGDSTAQYQSGFKQQSYKANNEANMQYEQEQENIRLQADQQRDSAEAQKNSGFLGGIFG